MTSSISKADAVLESRLRHRLINLSYKKLRDARRSSSPLRRSLHVLNVLRDAHEYDAKFAPECTDLLRKSRLVVVVNPAPVQRIPKDEAVVPQQKVKETLYSSYTDEEQMELGPTNDGSSMARKRKAIAVTDTATEKRHATASS